jgi:hypothetical protein
MAKMSGSLSRSEATKATKQSENSPAGSAFITSLSVSWEGTPRSNDRACRGS